MDTPSFIQATIKQLYADTSLLNQKIEVSGWVRHIRTSGGKGREICFVRLYDGSCNPTLQVICAVQDLPDDNKNYFEDLFKRGKSGISLKIRGVLSPSPSKGQTVELHADWYEIIGDVANPETYPITKSGATLETLRSIPHLRGRTETFGCVDRIRSVASLAYKKYFAKQGFCEVQVPLVTDNECESGANPFRLTTILDKKVSDVPALPDGSVDYGKDFFKKPVYLTVSGQLHLEAKVLGGLGRAFCTTTAFRAEPSLSPLHAAEFWMVELEMCFSQLADNIRANEECIKYCIQQVLKHCMPDLEFMQKNYKPNLIARLQKYAITPFVITTHAECVSQMLADIASGKVQINPSKAPTDPLTVFKEAPGLADDLSKDHEKYICQVLYDNIPVFVCHYPAAIKAFYMPKINKGSDIERVDNFDMLMPEIGEVVGGSQREMSYEELKARMIENHIDPQTLQFYLDLRKYGSVPHGGSGIGFDRLMLALTGLSNIRDTIPFPRAYEYCLF